MSRRAIGRSAAAKIGAAMSMMTKAHTASVGQALLLTGGAWGYRSAGATDDAKPVPTNRRCRSAAAKCTVDYFIGKRKEQSPTCSPAGSRPAKSQSDCASNINHESARAAGGSWTRNWPSAGTHRQMVQRDRRPAIFEDTQAGGVKSQPG